MSENRQKYAVSPLNGSKQARGNGRQPSPSRRPQRAQHRKFVFLQVVMSLALPVLFIVALILGYREVHWGFIALSALALAIMYATHAFVEQARTTMTMIYCALIMVSGAAALWFTQPMLDQTGGQTQQNGDVPSGLFDRDVTMSEVNGIGVQQSGAVGSAGTPTPDARSEAQAQLDLFMRSWMNLDYAGMVSYCSPAWVNAQEDPQHSIFRIRGTSTPVDYSFLTVSGSNANDSCTITMEASIDKGTGREAQRYRYEVLMLRVNGVWYVDPASLSSASEIVDNTTPTATYTMMPTYTPDVNQTLYYNPDGGSFYHADPMCSKVSNKYLPLKGSFIYSQLDEAAYKSLEPCPDCNAPNRP